METTQPSLPGALLVQTRKRAELTQEELAERAGVSVNTISNLEAGRGHLPRQATLDLLVHALATALALTPPEQADLRAAFRDAVQAGRARQLRAPDDPAAPPAPPGPPLLPAGTLTFLVCAPACEPRDGPRLPPHVTISRLAALLRQVVPARGGLLVDPPEAPDGAICVFPRADDAARAACILQQALLGQSAPRTPTPTTPNIQPRCLALHTGWAEPGASDDYAGPTRRRATRLARLGHTGQILLTQTTRELIGRSLPEGARMHGMGQHRLSVVERPQPIYQIMPTPQPAASPPPRALDQPPTNLPMQLTSFIGREREQTAIGALLARAPLVTLTGTGGCGKTRLALAVAADLVENYPDGVWLVELAALPGSAAGGPPLVPRAVATVLNLRDEQSRPLLDTLGEHLQSRRLLLVLDNCEHLLAACAQMASALLRRCPHLQLLATSRERLGVGGETTYWVPSLTLPAPEQQPPVATLGTYEGVWLFVERARACRPDFALTEENAEGVMRICRRLDGVPLAIELAAARVGSLPLATIAARLTQSLGVLTAGPREALPRQQTLRATLDWSWALLGEPERVLLRRLSVFAGGWMAEAAERVCRGPALAGWPLVGLLGGLVSKSLVGLQESGQTARYTLLETVRQYAAEQLIAAGELVEARDQQLDWCVALAEEAEPALTGVEQECWLARLETEHDNMRAALGWARERNHTGRALRLAGALWHFWEIRGHFGEGRHWLEDALAREDGPGALRARALHGAGRLAFQQDEYERATTLLGKALALWRELGSRQDVASSLHSLGSVANLQGDYARAAALYDEALALRRDLGDTWGTAESLNSLGTVAYEQSDYARAAALYQDAVALFRDVGDGRGLASSLNNLGVAASEQGEYGRAMTLLGEALALYRTLDDRQGIATALDSQAFVAYEQGQYERAAALHQETLALRRQLGDRQGIVHSLKGLGWVAHARAEYGRAAALHQEALLLSRDLGSRDLAEENLEALSHVAGAQGQARRAAQLGGAAEILRETLGVRLAPGLRAGHRRTIQALRAALGEEGFAAAWAEGRALSLEQAVALALA